MDRTPTPAEIMFDVVRFVPSASEFWRIVSSDVAHSASEEFVLRIE